MDVSLRHWPIFATGLLLGAAGTMSLGLHRPTQMELEAAASYAVARPATTSSVSAPALPAVPATQTTAASASPERAGEQGRMATENFRAPDAQDPPAASMQVAVTLAQPPKPRIRRVPTETDLQMTASPIAPAPPTVAAPNVALNVAPNDAPNIAPEPADAVARPRVVTSVMGAAPESNESGSQPD